MTPSSGPVRFGVLGFGHHARRRLVGSFRDSGETVLRGLWRRDQAQQQKDAAECGIALSFPSREALCASDEIDAVFVTSPDAMHLEDTLLAVRHGKAVLCEKPMAMNAGEAEQMQRAAEEAGVLLGVAQNLRWSGTVEFLRAAILAGQIGEPQMARATYSYPALQTPRRWIANGSLACGGPIGDVGVHCLDALRFAVGQEVESIATVARGDARYPGMEAVATMHGVMSGGCLLEVSVSAFAPYRTQIEVAGSEGVLVAEDGLAVDRPVRMELWRGGERVSATELSNGASYTAMLDSFARAMRGEAVFSASATDGVTNMRLLDAAYRGWRSGGLERVGG